MPEATARPQLADLRKWHAKVADSETGGALEASNGGVTASDNNLRGRKLGEWLGAARAEAKARRMEPPQAEDWVMGPMSTTCPSEWRILKLQDRLNRRENDLHAIAKGESQFRKAEQESAVNTARKVDASRTQRFDRAEERKKRA